jgi:hypothetical protein
LIATRYGFAQVPAIPCTLCTLNSGGAAAPALALAAGLSDGAAAFGEIKVPTT